MSLEARNEGSLPMSAWYFSSSLVKYMLLEMWDSFLCLDLVRWIRSHVPWCCRYNKASLIKCLTQLRAYKH